jgi:hypothetical protein
MAARPFLFRVSSLGPGHPLPAPPHPGLFVRAGSAFEAWRVLAQLNGIEPTSVELELVLADKAPSGAELIEIAAGTAPVGQRWTRRTVGVRERRATRG